MTMDRESDRLTPARGGPVDVIDHAPDDPDPVDEDHRRRGFGGFSFHWSVKSPSPQPRDEVSYDW